jgi:hypothetical protein
VQQQHTGPTFTLPRSNSYLSPANRKLNKIFAFLPSHNFTFLTNKNKNKNISYSGTTRTHINRHVNGDGQGNYY